MFARHSSDKSESMGRERKRIPQHRTLSSVCCQALLFLRRSPGMQPTGTCRGCVCGQTGVAGEEMDCGSVLEVLLTFQRKGEHEISGESFWSERDKHHGVLIFSLSQTCSSYWQCMGSIKWSCEQGEWGTVAITRFPCPLLLTKDKW